MSITRELVLHLDQRNELDLSNKKYSEVEVDAFSGSADLSIM